MLKKNILKFFISLGLVAVLFCFLSCILQLNPQEDKETIQKQEFELTVLGRNQQIYFEWIEPEGVDFTNLKIECHSDDDGAMNPNVYDRAIKSDVFSYIRTGVSDGKVYSVSFEATGDDGKSYSEALTVTPKYISSIVKRVTAITFDGMTYVSLGVPPKYTKDIDNEISVRVYKEGIRLHPVKEFQIPAYEVIDSTVPDNYEVFDKYYGIVIDEEFEEGEILQVRTSDATMNETNIYEVEVKTVELPVVELNLDLNDENFLDFTNKKKISGSLSVFNCSKNSLTEVPILVKGRGNSSWTNTPKKSYTINFDSNLNFLGMAKNKTFLLIANYFDKTLIRNTACYDIAYDIFTNLIWAPDSVSVNLFINGVYQGIYSATESVKIAKERIPLNGYEIDNYDKGTDFSEYAYLLEVNTRLDEDFNFVTNYDETKSFDENINCVPFSLKEPEGKEIDDLMELKYGSSLGSELVNKIKNYIETYINEVQQKLYSDDFADENSENYYENYLDIDSFVDWWILEEFAKNTDSNFFASCYMYYDPLDKLIHMGPVWDFDLAFGNNKLNSKAENFLSDEMGVLEDENSVKYAHRGNWLCRLREDEKFMNKISERWNELLPLIELYFENEFVERVDEIKIDSELNFARWDILGEQIWLSPEGYEYRTTYQSEIDYFINWKNERINWLKTQF